MKKIIGLILLVFFIAFPLACPDCVDRMNRACWADGLVIGSGVVASEPSGCTSATEDMHNDYSESDTEGRFSTSSGDTSKITITALDSNEGPYVYKTGGHASNDTFKHCIEFSLSKIENWCKINIGVVAGAVGSRGDNDTGNVEQLGVSIYFDGQHWVFKLEEIDDSTVYQTSAITFPTGDTKTGYCEIARINTSSGASNAGQATLSVYTDSGKETQIGSTQTLDLHTDVNYTQYMPVQGYDTGNDGDDLNGYVDNVDLCVD